MSTPDQPETPPLTRRQLREIRNTGATPVFTPDDIARDEEARAEAEMPSAEPIVESETVVEPEAEELPAAVEDAVEEATVSDDATASPAAEERIAPGSFADLAVAPLTRRQAREHERIRTASVPIIAPDASPAVPAEPVDAVPVEAPPQQDDEAVASDGPAAGAVIAEVPGLFRPAAVEDEDPPVAIVNPHFGSGLLAGETPVVELPPSFDQLISRTGSTGVSSSTPNALILSQTPAAAPLVAPVTATGEVLITGTFDLPEGLGSVGHAPGLHDGKDVDAVLVDGELPAASSPTPIAASAAISQVRNSDEIIRPPAPEKGGGLVVALIITASVALVAAVGVLVLAFTTGGIF